MELKTIIILVFIIQTIFCREEVEDSTEEREEETDFKRLENEFAVAKVSTTSETYENVTNPVISTMNELSSKESNAFKPSVHLGEIDEEEKSNSNPFNNLKHIKFENYVVNPEDLKSDFYSVQSRKKNKLKINNNKNNIKNNNENFNFASFNNNNNNNNNNFGHSYNLEPFQTPSLSSFKDQYFPSGFSEKPFFEPIPLEKPPVVFSRPEKFYSGSNFVTPYSEEIEDYQFVQLPNFEGRKKKRPELMYPVVQETPVTRNQKFPYKFYQEPTTFHESSFEYIADEHAVSTMAKEKRLSPWKKIIHLIGTFLPFGLLLATLSPNIIQVGNSTQPNIALSKLRDVNLSPEHKNARMVDDPMISEKCEERNICEIILEGSRAKSNLLQNVLWNFAMRTTEEGAKQNGLQNLFDAVKKKDCSLVDCANAN